MKKLSTHKQAISKKLASLGMDFSGEKVNGTYTVGSMSFQTLDEIELYIAYRQRDARRRIASISFEAVLTQPGAINDDSCIDLMQRDWFRRLVEKARKAA